jgi:hypothetical protein
MLRIDDRQCTGMHVTVPHRAHVGRVHELKDQLVGIRPRAALHARLVSRRAIMRQHQVISVLMIDRHHLTIRTREQDFHDRGARGSHAVGGHDLVGRLTVLISPHPGSDEGLERIDGGNGLFGWRILLAGEQFARGAIPHDGALPQAVVPVAIGTRDIPPVGDARHMLVQSGDNVQRRRIVGVVAFDAGRLDLVARKHHVRRRDVVLVVPMIVRFAVAIHASRVTDRMLGDQFFVLKVVVTDEARGILGHAGRHRFVVLGLFLGLVQHQR